MDEIKEDALVERVKNLNLCLEYDSGFLSVTHSMSADQQRDDDGELENALLEQLGKNLPDVARIAVEKARGVRGRNFVGRQVFVPSIKTFGTLESVGEDGIVRVAHSRENYKDPELPEIDLVHTGSGADLLVIVNDGEPAPASWASFTWINDENLRRLFEVADRDAGLRLEHDSGFLVVKCRAIGDADRATVEGRVRQFGAKLEEVSTLMAARARGETRAKFRGRRVLVPAFFNSFGTFDSVGSDGKVTVTYIDPHTKSKRTCFCQGDVLLLVPDQRAAAEPTPQDSETIWQKFFRRIFGS